METQKNQGMRKDDSRKETNQNTQNQKTGASGKTGNVSTGKTGSDMNKGSNSGKTGLGSDKSKR